MLKFNTNLGEFTIELYPDDAPKTVENFVQYAKSGFFEETIFHRIIPGFVIQGGGMTSDLQEKKTRNPIVNEADNGLKNLKYTLSMARTQDPHSASSQFFINLSDNDFLDHTAKSGDGWGYAVFGKVVEGTDTIDKMGKVKTTTRGFYEDVPVEPVVVESVEVIED